jgi:hypothetical protein
MHYAPTIHPPRHQPAFMKKLDFFFLFLCLFHQTACQSKPIPYWTLQNIDATNERVQQVKKTLQACDDGLQKVFVQTPGPLLILTYGSRPSFVEGLKKEQGFSEEAVAFFRDKSAPRPLNGKYLIPPDQKLVNVCHEIVHHYLETNTSREHLLNGAKWFDEGSASYFSRTLLQKNFLEEQKKAFIAKGPSTFLPLSPISTEALWETFRNNLDQRDLAYTQSCQMVRYFFEHHTIKDYQTLLFQMKTLSFEESFQKVTDISVAEFYEEWKKAYSQ